MRKQFVKALASLAAADPKVFFITGDLGFGVMDDYAKRFPHQYLNVGVAEQNMLGVATGLALEGRTVFVYSIGNFPTLRCLEQIRNDALYHDANVKVVSIGGGFSYGPLGFSHHATEDLAILRALPGVTVVAPGDLWEAHEATQAVARQPGVCYLRLDKSAAQSSPRAGERFTLGSARTVRDGHDVTLIAAGGILEEALRAADALQERGLQARVISMHTVFPLDEAAICRAARETGGIVTIEEHGVTGGLGGAVAETCLSLGAVPAFFHRIGLRGGLSTAVGSQSYLRQHYHMDAAAILDVVRHRIGCNPGDKVLTNAI